MYLKSSANLLTHILLVWYVLPENQFRWKANSLAQQCFHMIVCSFSLRTTSKTQVVSFHGPCNTYGPNIYRLVTPPIRITVHSGNWPYCTIFNCTTRPSASTTCNLLLTTHRIVIFEKLLVPHLVKKLIAFYRNPKFITVFTTTRLLVPTLSHMNPIYIWASVFFEIHFNIILLHMS